MKTITFQELVNIHKLITNVDNLTPCCIVLSLHNPCMTSTKLQHCVYGPLPIQFDI